VCTGNLGNRDPQIPRRFFVDQRYSIVDDESRNRQ